MDELRNLPDGERIDWSATASKYNIPQKNGGQILKALAEERGIDVSKQDQQLYHAREDARNASLEEKFQSDRRACNLYDRSQQFMSR